MKHPKTVGWGECGLDYFKNQPKEFEIQKGVFRRQIIEAVRFNKTLVIHCRGDCEKVFLFLFLFLFLFFLLTFPHSFFSLFFYYDKKLT